MKIWFYLLLIVSPSYLYSQVDNLTPEGSWADFEFLTSPRNNYGQLIDATDTIGNQLYYWFEKGTLSLLEPDSNYEDLRFLEQVAGWSYFIATDLSDQSHFFRFKEGIIDVLPSTGNWITQFPKIVMSDSSIFTGLTVSGAIGQKPCRIDSSGLQILDDTLYYAVITNSSEVNSRYYHSVWDTMGARWLAYYDLDDGYVRTDIPAASVALLSGDPGDDTHRLIVNHSEDSIFSKIYRYNTGVFNQVFIPGGPYDDINLLYRNEATNTSLFSLVDTSGNVRVAKRKSGLWTDESNRFADMISVTPFPLVSFENDCFFQFNTGEMRQLVNFQSYPAGDTFFIVTPSIDTFTDIRRMTENFDYPLTIKFSGNDREYLYDFFYGQVQLLPPPNALLNPGDSATYRIDNKKNGFYTFTYQNNQSEDHTFIYHRIAPGNTFNPVSTKTSTDAISLCSTPTAGVFRETDHVGDNTYYVYNLDSTSQLQFSVLDTFNTHTLISEGETCLISSSQESMVGEDPVLLYMWHVIDNRLIDITLPSFQHSESTYEYFGSDVFASLKMTDPEFAALYRIKQVSRFGDPCNADIKFFRDDTFGSQGNSYISNAQEFYFRGFVPEYTGESSSINFNYDSHFTFEIGTEISAEMRFTINQETCNSPFRR